MKRVPVIAGVISAVLSFLSVPAQNIGDSTAISDSAGCKMCRYFEDSLLVYNYIGLSKICISKNPDSSLIWADHAIRIASITNNLQLMGDAITQKQLVQKANAERIKNRMIILNNSVNQIITIQYC